MAGDGLASLKSWLYHPPFPDHWKRRPLYSLARWVNGLAFRDIQFGQSGKPVIKIAEIKEGISGQTKFTTQVFNESVHIRAGDLLFSWSGQPETSIDVFWWRGPDGWLNQHSFRVTPAQGIDPTFFYYLLRYLKPSFIGIARNKQTTGLGHVTKRDLEDLEAAYPGLPEQRAIAHVLGKLDDKIELNRRMSQTLETMARALFRSWFVDFGPVRAKAEGSTPGLTETLAELFPGSFAGSEGGGIPEGWIPKQLGDCVDILSGGTPSTAKVDLWQGDIPWISPKVMTAIHADEAEAHVGKSAIGNGTRLAPAGSTLVMVRGMGLHEKVRVSQARRAVTFNQDVKALIGKSIDPELLFFGLLDAQSQLLERVESSGHGTGTLPSQVLLTLPLVMPPSSIQARLAEPFRVLNERIATARNESRSLAALRDRLLPRLVSGELRVTEAQRAAEEAGL